MNKRIIVALVALPLLAAGCGGPVTVDRILDRAEEAMGGDALEEIRSLRILTGGTREFPAGGAPPEAYEGRIVYQAPDRIYWEVRTEAGAPVIMAFDGAEAWGLWNGPPARYRGAARDLILEAAAEVRALFVAPARAGDGDAFSLPSAAPEGVPATYRVDYAPASGGAWTLWFDRKSGHLVRGEHEYLFLPDRKPMLGSWTRSEPRAFGELTVPSRTQFEGSREGFVLERIDEAVRSIEINPDLPSDFFSRPAREIDLNAIGIKTVPAETVITLRHTGGFDAIGEAMDRLAAAAIAAGRMPAGPVSGIIHDDPRVASPEELRIDLSLPLLPADGPAQLPEGFSIRERPAIRVVFGYHSGPLAGEGRTHARIQAWMSRKRLGMAGPPRSLWYHHPDSVVPEDLVTEVRYPIR